MRGPCQIAAGGGRRRGRRLTLRCASFGFDHPCLGLLGDITGSGVAAAESPMIAYHKLRDEAPAAGIDGEHAAVDAVRHEEAGPAGDGH
jgi:hypothetical protein